ncbi:hypothetical protein SERLADRAFT_437867 [Serpula lacrymans var. lacrymans S7.9]|uniref:Uncharacterized protein n=1 Tax=Serpula lacrymans var. lacrymans (strain S7.9) TaxID=578457 RepID=F8NVU5_SERL9|nr:uncharacterized protein SERLADRAFT_437867 [Serpula lacrymans var. lacrymans S7.9]EGO24256.1 hypothetical protein SERLADRAFT_437867 [Serpula lacrymans var. lacrymans S7.9]
MPRRSYGVVHCNNKFHKCRTFCRRKTARVSRGRRRRSGRKLGSRTVRAKSRYSRRVRSRYSKATRRVGSRIEELTYTVVERAADESITKVPLRFDTRNRMVDTCATAAYAQHYTVQLNHIPYSTNRNIRKHRHSTRAKVVGVCTRFVFRISPQSQWMIRFLFYHVDANAVDPQRETFRNKGVARSFQDEYGTYRSAPVGFTGKVVNCSDDTSGDPHFMPFDWMHRQSYGLERRDVYMYGYPVRSTGFRPFYELRRTFKNGSGVAQNQPFNLFKPMNHTYEYNEDVDEFSFTKLDHPNPNPTRKALFFTMIAYCVAPGPRMDFVPPNYKPLDKDHKKKFVTGRPSHSVNRDRFDNPYDRLPGESEAAFEARVENLDAAVNETTGAGWGDSISTLQQQKRAAVKGKAKQPDAGPSKPKTRSASKAEEDGDSSDDSDDGSPVKGLNPLNVGPEFAWLEAELTTRVWFRDAPALRTKKLGNFEPIEMVS